MLRPLRFTKRTLIEMVLPLQPHPTLHELAEIFDGLASTLAELPDLPATVKVLLGAHPEIHIAAEGVEGDDRGG